MKALQQAISPVSQTENLSLSELGGRILAKPVLSPQDVPDQPRSAMDGISIAYDCLDNEKLSIPLRIQILGKSLAGHSAEGQITNDSACRIFTGAVVQSPHDTVIPQELVSFDETQSSASFDFSKVQKGSNVRARGEDLRAGFAALDAGTVIGPREIALLASMGFASAEVFRKVRIAVLSTGDEVVEPGRTLSTGKTYDANRPMLLEMIRNCNATAIDLGVVGDDAKDLTKTISHAATIADAVITSGGVSVGEADHTKEVMKSLGEISFWKLAIKPGRPLAAGSIKTQGANGAGETPFFGLPGNPVAAFVTFQSVVAPCLQKLSGAKQTPSATLRARLAKDARKTPGRTEYLRCSLTRDENGEWIAQIAASQGAASLKSLTDADGLVVLPHDAGPLAAGSFVDVILL